MKKLKRILLLFSSVSALAVIQTGCDKEDAGVLPGLQIVRVGGGIKIKNDNTDDLSKNMYRGYIHYTDFLGSYYRENAFGSMSFAKEATYLLNSTNAPTKAVIRLEPMTKETFAVIDGHTYNPNLTVAVAAMADISDGRSVSKNIQLHFTGPVSGSELIGKYLETFRYEITVEAKILENGEPDIIIESKPAN